MYCNGNKYGVPGFPDFPTKMKNCCSKFKDVFALLIVCCIAVALSGCYPSVSGVLLDTDTHVPVQGATIQLEDQPKTRTVSDCNGFFKTKSYLDLLFILPIDIFEFHFEIYQPDYGFHKKKILTEEIYRCEGTPKLYIRKDPNEAH